MNTQTRHAELKRMLQIIIIVCLASAALTLAIGFWIPAKAELAQHLLEHAFEQELEGKGDTKPWPWADTSPVARLSIPDLDASWIVLSGASGRTLAFAPALMDGSAVLGTNGVSVIAAHRDTHFAALENIEIGMHLVIDSSDGDSHVYQVTETQVVDSRTTQVRLDAETPRILLTTCYPFDALSAGGPLRFVVSADAI